MPELQLQGAGPNLELSPDLCDIRFLHRKHAMGSDSGTLSPSESGLVWRCPKIDDMTSECCRED